MPPNLLLIENETAFYLLLSGSSALFRLLYGAKETIETCFVTGKRFVNSALGLIETLGPNGSINASETDFAVKFGSINWQACRKSITTINRVRFVGNSCEKSRKIC